MPQNKAAICRAVYYRTKAGRDLAATITKVNDDGTVTLTVANTEDEDLPFFRVANCEESPSGPPEQSRGVPGNTWRWPRVV